MDTAQSPSLHKIGSLVSRQVIQFYVNTIFTSHSETNDLIIMYFHECKHDVIPMCA